MLPIKCKNCHDMTHLMKRIKLFFVFKAKLDVKLILTPIDPNFEQYESKDFFNLIVSRALFCSFILN